MTIARIFLFASVILLGQTCAAQTKAVSVPANSRGDTTLWFKWQQEWIHKAGLPNLIHSKDSLHFRFSTETQSVDIWTADFRFFHGTLSDYTTSYNPPSHNREKPKPGKFYSHKTDLDTATARDIYDLFETLSVFSIPTDADIKAWQPGEDGNEYLVEYATPQRYSFKSYWTPSYYKSRIPEAAIIDSVAQRLETVLHLQKVFGTFIHTLPHGSYRAGGMAITVATKKKKKQTNG